MASSVAASLISGGSIIKSSDASLLKRHSNQSPNTALFVKKSKRNVSICARYSDGGRQDTGDFVVGFILGGAIGGALAYIFAPQVRKFVQNENEHGFARARPPNYFDDGGLESTRHTLHEKISQLNNAIDKVSSRLRGVQEKVEADELDGVC